MTDFITDLKQDILTANPDILPDWAEHCAIAPLSTIVHEAQVIEKTALLRLNLYMLTIGPPGIGKSLPMMVWTRPIVAQTGELINRDLFFPSRSSVPSFIEYVNEGKEEEQIPRNVGILIRDEFSGMFKEFRNADWQSDAMEFVSEMYDGTYQKRSTIKHGLSTVSDLYACMITATTPYFVSKLDKEFYIQGTGNRFLYSYHAMEDYNPKEIDPLDYFSEDWKYRNKKIDGYASRLQQLHEKKVEYVIVDQEAGILWAKYKLACEQQWKERGIKDPLGWEYHPIKRYAEFALKLSGIYAISEYIDKIIEFTDKRWETEGRSVFVRKKHMQRAIDLVERNRKQFEQIVLLKYKNVPKEQAKSLEDKAKSMLIYLSSAKGGILTNNDWKDTQDITANPNEFIQLRNMCVKRRWAEQIEEKDVPEDIRRDLGIIYPATKIYRFIEQL